MSSGCLFAGAGALELAVGSVLDVEPVWFVENDPAASKVLAHHWPGVPNSGDITTVDWDTVEPIDVLTGGFPCVDVSSAGKRAGLRPGTRSGLWSHMAYAINKLRPKLVVIENVRGLLSTAAACDLEPCPWCVGDDEDSALRACGAVCGDLASLGFDAEWVSLRASDVGAPHGRFRVFIVARPAVDGVGVGWGEGRTEPAGQQWGFDAAQCGDAATPNTASTGRRRFESVDVGQDGEVAVLARQTEPGRCDCAAPDSDRGELQRRGIGGVLASQERTGEREGPQRQRDRNTTGDGREDAHSPRSWVSVDGTDYGPAIYRWETILGRRAPNPTVTGQRGGQQLSPYFTEWMQGWPDGWVTTVPGLSRNDMIRLAGNGVVPHQAAEAVALLLNGSL